MLGQAQKLAPKPFLMHFSKSEKCFKNGFGASSGSGPELALKALLKQFSEFEKCFKKRFGVSSGPGPELAQKSLLKHFSGTEKSVSRRVLGPVMGRSGFFAVVGHSPNLSLEGFLSIAPVHHHGHGLWPDSPPGFP